MSTITDHLDELVELIEAKGIQISNDLKPGLTKEEINVRTEVLHFKIPDELYELYSWHNGQDDEGVIPLFRGSYLISLEEALNDYYTVQTYKEDPEDDFLSYCFPFAHDEGGIYVLPTSSQPLYPELTRPVIDIHEGVDVLYTSFINMLVTINTCFKDGAYIIDPCGKYGPYDQNDALETQIMKKLNPGLYG
ncbi:SMI1/KNR4 family protein [Acaryochloris marina]|uniref:SMI1/KNR4 family protein n=1 Tax=Acaryochloris marina TaxID=155978 RepID=UPI001BAE7D0D|nr:SMI1/KNR4 family protein [Acaryochloris marina]QUY44725.1 SMI1/KNR4 family protein [Acaryochloris marina S15]